MTALSQPMKCSITNILVPWPEGVYIRWNGMVEWNSEMDYWNGGMLHRTYLTIQHVLYSEQWALRCVLCMHCWLDGWLARLVLHCMNFELWPRPGYTFTRWCMQTNQAPQYVLHLITNCHFSFFTYCMSTIRRCILACMQRTHSA